MRPIELRALGWSILDLRLPWGLFIEAFPRKKLSLCRLHYAMQTSRCSQNRSCEKTGEFDETGSNSQSAIIKSARSPLQLMRINPRPRALQPRRKLRLVAPPPPFYPTHPDEKTMDVPPETMQVLGRCRKTSPPPQKRVTQQQKHSIHRQRNGLLRTVREFLDLRMPALAAHKKTATTLKF